MRAGDTRRINREARRVSVVALNGMTFDLATPHGRMMATVLAGIAEFELELLQERIRSGIRYGKGTRQAAWPPTRPQAKVGPARPESDGARRKGTQLPPDRARGRPKQEHRGRYRQTSPRRADSGHLTATLHPVTRMLALGHFAQLRGHWASRA